MYTVYMHTCKSNDKKYIGITCQEPWTKRFNGTKGTGYKSCILFYRAIEKYGWENFEHQILTTCKTEDEAKNLERYYIDLYQSNNPEYGYNVMEGGQTQRYPQSVKDHISQANKGKPSSMLGRHHSEETKQKISNSQKGRKMPEAHRRKLDWYYETLRHKPTFHMPTEEENNRLKERSQKKIRIVETGQTFNSMSECADYLNVHISNLSRYVSQGKEYHGYHFEKICS